MCSLNKVTKHPLPSIIAVVAETQDVIWKDNIVQNMDKEGLKNMM
jgi:hypothetical protein